MLKRKKTRIGACWQDSVFLTLDTLMMIVFGVLIAYPLLFILLESFDASPGTLSLNLIPKQWSIEGYRAVFEYKWIWIGYRNSLAYTVAGTALGLMFCVLAAYPLSQPELRGRGAFMAVFLFTMYFGGGLIPTYLTMRSYRMLDTVWVLLLPGAVNVYNMIIMRTYFGTQIPRELKEASQLDGCGEVRYLLSVVLPVSGSILAVIGLYYAVGIWNSYFDAMIYMDTKAKMPLSVFLRDLLILNDSTDITSSMDPDLLVSLQERQNVMKYSLIVVSCVPMFLLYPFVQKYFVKGVMIGSVKG